MSLVILEQRRINVETLVILTALAFGLWLTYAAFVKLFLQRPDQGTLLRVGFVICILLHVIPALLAGVLSPELCSISLAFLVAQKMYCL